MTFPRLDRHSDLHVHSTFSDGASTIDENLASAAGHGLHTLGMVDHVRRSTDWVPSFVDAVRALDGHSGLRVLCGVEAKILDTSGLMDMPADMPTLDYVLVADHQLPRPDGPMHPRDAEALLAEHELSTDEVIADLVEATVNALGCYDRVIVAHLFSILPKCGLHEDQVPDALVRRIGQAVVRHGAVVEVNEKWSCPSRRVVDLLVGEGVPITMSTDAHHEQRVGRYDYVTSTLAHLTADVTAEQAVDETAAGAPP
ncbi:PHP domain-containing protein [Desertimonas flava]|uniref:PHP domain-containing protein n=1 Tax=Desertimonas flava TaxID=2064846 RepID=UPI000E351B70|nr:PHP domain-containing protein [Desertimonas flava]